MAQKVGRQNWDGLYTYIHILILIPNKSMTQALYCYIDLWLVYTLLSLSSFVNMSIPSCRIVYKQTMVKFSHVKVSYLNMHFHCSLMWYTHKCIVYQQIMRTMLSQHCRNFTVNIITINSILVPYVVCVSVPCVELHEHNIMDHGNHVVRFGHSNLYVSVPNM